MRRVDRDAGDTEQHAGQQPSVDPHERVAPPPAPTRGLRRLYTELQVALVPWTVAPEIIRLHPHLRLSDFTCLFPYQPAAT
jgi:hypothetical protein